MFVSKTMRLTSYLIGKGFEVKKEELDRKNPKYKVWLFEQSPQLWAEVEKYSHRDKENK